MSSDAGRGADLAGGFALGTFSRPGAPTRFPGLVVGDRVLDLRAGPRAVASTRDLLADWDAALPRLSALAADPAGEWLELAGLRVHAPVEPRQVVQAGMNYRTHVLDLVVAHAAADDPRDPAEIRAEAAARMDARPPGDPVLFLGSPTAVAGPFDDLVLPGYSTEHDWELELAAVIGRPAFRVGRDEALGHVAAYTIANDVTTRDLVMREGTPGMDWFRSKNAPGFLPTGPFLVPAAAVGDPMGLHVLLTVNGTTMQDESTKDMLVDVAGLVSAASRTLRLLPGDLLLTGSPAGNGKGRGRMLRPGDVMAGSITGLGEQVVRCVAEPAGWTGEPA
ncbi:fumarylacetoacetate hydrolase family protein [Pseudonocardia lacus]|uniref:fumarylacetoacetate hydrolase family protein n=1 Tax=Pseudonocardia lacus TaxID=2835865 RepID=UPI001BDD442B|nr:fumarylacetoacetate hydrolase family protein [Pseudonocardia lacus]